ncbi:MAG: hypothetical protein AB1439_04210 [candidate division FCPU426 bacterium]
MQNVGRILLLITAVLAAVPAVASELSVTEIFDHLKAHQDQIKTIEAEFAMTVFGVEGFKLEQSGTYVFIAPDKVVMEFVAPRAQTVKTEGGKSFISVSHGAFKEIPTGGQQAGMSSDLFQYAFLKQFYLDIDLTNKPADSNLYRVLGYFRNEDGTMASSESMLNQKALEFIYDRNRGLVTQMNFTGSGPMPPIEVKQVYEEKNGCWVPKSVFTKVITPGGAISSVVKMNNKIIGK